MVIKLFWLFVCCLVFSGLASQKALLAQAEPIATFPGYGLGITSADGYVFIQSTSSSSSQVKAYSGALGWAEVGHLAASDPGYGAFFGNTMASGAGFLAVSDPGPDFAGIVYIYGDTGLRQTITEPSPGYGAGFGQSLAISGDWLVIGAPASLVEDCVAGVNGFFYGQAYLYHYAPSHGWQLAEQINRCATGSGFFGGAVAAVPLRDGVEVLVGDPSADDDEGAVYPFQVNQGANGYSLTSLGTLQAPDGEMSGIGTTGSGFGSSIAANASGNVVVGAPHNLCPVNCDSGRAYIFTPEQVGSGAYSLVYRGELRAYGDEQEDFFGTTVAISNSNLVAVSGYNYDHGRGIVEVFGRNGNPARGGLVETINSCNESDFDIGSRLAFAGDQLLVRVGNQSPEVVSKTLLFNLNVPNGCA